MELIFAFETGMPNVRVVHHQDLNKRILVALIIASSLLGGVLLFLSCFWISRQRKLKNSNGKSTKRMGNPLPHECNIICFSLLMLQIAKIMNPICLHHFLFLLVLSSYFNLKRLQKDYHWVQLGLDSTPWGWQIGKVRLPSSTINYWKLPQINSVKAMYWARMFLGMSTKLVLMTNFLLLWRN